jgi:hypothetical protein
MLTAGRGNNWDKLELPKAWDHCNEDRKLSAEQEGAVPLLGAVSGSGVAVVRALAQRQRLSLSCHAAGCRTLACRSY